MPIFLGDKLISNIHMGSPPVELTGDASPSDVRKGKTFYKDSFDKLTGTLEASGPSVLALKLNLTDDYLIGTVEYKPMLLNKLSYSNFNQPEAQIWDGYPRSPVYVADYPSQVIFKNYGNEVKLLCSTGRFHRLPSGTQYIRNEHITRAYTLYIAGSFWIFEKEVSGGAYNIERYGEMLQSIVPIYTRDNFSAIYTDANTVVDEGD